MRSRPSAAATLRSVQRAWGLPAGSLPVRRRFEDGDVIVRQGEPATGLYVVLSGAVMLTAVSPAGREAVLGLLGPPLAFGQASLSARAHGATARAVGGCFIMELRVGSERAQGPGQGAGVHSPVQLLAARIEALEEWLADLVLYDVPVRVARRLSDLVEGFGVLRPEGVLIDLPVTQGRLAAMVGASRESVNRALAQLAARGVLRRVGRRHLVMNYRALLLAAGRHEDRPSSPSSAAPATPSR
jgi:CRP-like cAMP-binding protein